MNTAGIERIANNFKDAIYFKLTDNGMNISLTIEESKNYSTIINTMSIGQLYQLATMTLDRFKTIKLHSIDNEGTVYLNIVGLYGGMDPEGFIHT